MRTKQMKAFILAAIFAFESMVAGYVSVSAQTMPQNSIIEAVETVQIASETADTEAENIESETTDIEVENVESETTDIEVENVESETAVAEEDIASETATEKYSGTDGALDWSIDTEGHLTVSGNGDYVKREYSSETGWLAYKDEIKSATVNVTGITNTSYMFNACNNLEKVDLSGLVMSNAENVEIDMQYMFHLCNSLKSLNLSSLDTSKVTNMDHMFYNCKNLTSLDLSGLVTSKVTNMKAMFMTCESLTSLNLSDFDTTHVTDMTCMFSECSSLESLNVSSFETGNVKMMMNMFYDCSSLTSLDISNFDTTNVINMGSMFDYCSKLNTIYAPENKTQLDMALPTVENCTWIYQPTGENVTAIKEAGTYQLVKYYGVDGKLNWNINLDGHLTVSGNGDYEKRGWGEEGEREWTGETGWLAHKTEIKSATVNVSGITDTGYMFYGCSNLASLDISGLDTINVTDMQYMFYECSSLKSLNLKNLDTTSVTNMRYMFDGCSSLTSLDLSSFNTGSVTDMGDMFLGCSSLTSLDLSSFSTGNVTNMNGMFSGCSSLTSLEVSFITDSVTDMRMMFYGCSSLTRLYLIDSATSNVIDMSSFNTGSVTDMSSMFSGCSSLTSLYLISFDTSSVTDMSSMFYGCSSLTSLDLSSFSIGSVTNMNNMFDDCNQLNTIHAPENKSSQDMVLPVVEGCAWTYKPTGEIVTVITKAGTYLKGAVVIDNTDPEEGKPVGGDNTDPEGGKPVGGDNTESEEKIPVVETNTETKKDGSVVTTEKTTYPEGNVSMTIISTSKDKKKQTRVDMEIDAQKNLTSATIDVSKKVAKKTMTINLKELKNMVDQIEKCDVDYVHPLADGGEAESILTEDALSGSTEIVSIEDGFGGSTEGTSVAGMSLTGKSSKDEWTDENITWADELYVTAKKANISIKVTAKDNKGKDKYSLSIPKKDLTQKKFVVYSSDKKGNPVMTNPKSNYVKVNAKKDMTIKIASKGNYQLQNNKDAAKTNQKIMKTVTPKKQTVTVKKGSSTSFDLSSKCNKANISKITYKPDNNNVSVSAKGKISAKSSGTTKVTANVTMKNGAKKSIRMKVSVS